MNLILLHLLWYVIATAASIPQGNFRNCTVKAAAPIQVRYVDQSQNNCISGNLRVNQPFGLYTSRNGYLKWETLLRAQDCNSNYFYHAKCNIITWLPHVHSSLHLRVWRNCTWRYIVNQPAARRLLEN